MDLFGISAIFLVLLEFGGCAKILGIWHMPAYSHYALGGKLMKELAARGHEVTSISSFSQKTPVENLRDIDVSDLNKDLDGK